MNVCKWKKKENWNLKDKNSMCLVISQQLYLCRVCLYLLPNLSPPLLLPKKSVYCQQRQTHSYVCLYISEVLEIWNKMLQTLNKTKSRTKSNVIENSDFRQNNIIKPKISNTTNENRTEKKQNYISPNKSAKSVFLIRLFCFPFHVLFILFYVAK